MAYEAVWSHSDLLIFGRENSKALYIGRTSQSSWMVQSLTKVPGDQFLSCVIPAFPLFQRRLQERLGAIPCDLHSYAEKHERDNAQDAVRRLRGQARGEAWSVCV